MAGIHNWIWHSQWNSWFFYVQWTVAVHDGLYWSRFARWAYHYNSRGTHFVSFVLPEGMSQSECVILYKEFECPESLLQFEGEWVHWPWQSVMRWSLCPWWMRTTWKLPCWRGVKEFSRCGQSCAEHSVCLCPSTQGTVWSDLKHVRIPQHGECSDTWSEPWSDVVLSFFWSLRLSTRTSCSERARDLRLFQPSFSCEDDITRMRGSRLQHCCIAHPMRHWASSSGHRDTRTPRNRTSTVKLVRVPKIHSGSGASACATTSWETATAEQMQEALQQIQILTTRIATLETQLQFESGRAQASELTLKGSPDQDFGEWTHKVRTLILARFGNDILTALTFFFLFFFFQKKKNIFHLFSFFDFSIFFVFFFSEEFSSVCTFTAMHAHMLSVFLCLCNSRLQQSAHGVICIFETVFDALSLVLQRLQHVVQQCSLFGTSDQAEFAYSPEWSRSCDRLLCFSACRESCACVAQDIEHPTLCLSSVRDSRVWAIRDSCVPSRCLKELVHRRPHEHGWWYWSEWQSLAVFFFFFFFSFLSSSLPGPLPPWSTLFPAQISILRHYSGWEKKKEGRRKKEERRTRRQKQVPFHNRTHRTFSLIPCRGNPSLRWPRWKTSARRSKRKSETTEEQKRHEKVQNILEEFKGTHSIANEHTHMRNEVGYIETSRKVQKIRRCRSNERKDEKDSGGRLDNNCDHADNDENIEDDEQDNHLPVFTMKDLIFAIRRNNKIDTWHVQLHHQARVRDPSFSNKLMMTVIYKKESQRNQKTIAQSVPSQFSTILHNRQYATLDSYQSLDLVGFRKF